MIVPPSVLPDGRAYIWEGNSDPDEGALLADAPGWVLNLVVAESPVAPVSDPGGERISAGARNATLFKLGRSLRAKGLTADGVVAALRAENAACGDPPLPDAEVVALATSACSVPPGRTAGYTRPEEPPPWGETAAEWLDPEPLPEHEAGDAKDFPLHLLPAPIQTAVHEVARFVQIHEAAPALIGLATLATAVGKRAKVEEKRGLQHYPALFFAGIAETGERKSPTFREMTKPLEDWADNEVPEWEIAKRYAKARGAAIDRALTVAKSKVKAQGIDAATDEIAALEAERIPIPPHPRRFTTDATEQRLFQLMHDRGGVFAVLTGEGRPVADAIMGKYSGEGRTGDSIYLAGISGDTITRDRVGGEAGPEDRSIRGPCLNVCVMLQPDKYLELANHSALRESGAIARIWPVWLPSRVGSRFEAEDEPGLDHSAIEPYAALVRRILSRGNASEPHVATLSHATRGARRKFHNAIEALLAPGAELVDCRDIGAKAVSQTVKLALVLHLAERPEMLDFGGSEIDAATWATAQAIGTWFLTEAVRVRRKANEDQSEERARRVLHWLATARRATVTARELQREAPRPRLRAKEAAAALTLLADFGYLREEKPPGSRKPVFRVHPRLNVAREGA